MVGASADVITIEQILLILLTGFEEAIAPLAPAVPVIAAVIFLLALLGIAAYGISHAISADKKDDANIKEKTGNSSREAEIDREKGNDDSNNVKDGDTVITNQGNEIDVTPSDNHSSSIKNPGVKGDPNSSVDIVDEDGNVITRRWYDENGNAYRDVDMTNHGNPKQHPEVPHEHTWDWTNGKPIRR